MVPSPKSNSYVVSFEFSPHPTIPKSSSSVGKQMPAVFGGACNPPPGSFPYITSNSTSLEHPSLFFAEITTVKTPISNVCEIPFEFTGKSAPLIVSEDPSPQSNV